MTAQGGTTSGAGRASVRTPSGGAARLWLRERLALARGASDLLEQKRRALQNEVSRLAHHAEATERRWQEACLDAEGWTVRAELLGGVEQFLLVGATVAGTAEAHVTWHSLMGLAYPWEAACRWPGGPAATGLGGTAALSDVASAARTALGTAVEAAAARRALDLVTTELEVTTRRLRALEHRWIPRLEATLADVEFQLDEREREDVARLRWIALRTGGGTDGHP